MSRNVWTFDPGEWARIEAIALGRKSRNRSRGAEGTTDVRGEIMGVAAEIALGLAAGLAPEQAWAAASSIQPNPGWHARINGRTVRVQGTDRPGHLIERKTRAKADAYVLAHVKPEDRTVNLVGWVDRPTLLASTVKTTRGRDWTITSYWVRLGDLHLMSRLWGEEAAA